MYLPCLVLPYQREPGLWYTPESVFTHTMPSLLAGGAWVLGVDLGAADLVAGAGAGAGAGVEVAEDVGVVAAELDGVDAGAGADELLFFLACVVPLESEVE